MVHRRCSSNPTVSSLKIAAHIVVWLYGFLYIQLCNVGAYLRDPFILISTLVIILQYIILILFK